jgi:hypothetical protein
MVAMVVKLNLKRKDEICEKKDKDRVMLSIGIVPCQYGWRIAHAVQFWQN